MGACRTLLVPALAAGLVACGTGLSGPAPVVEGLDPDLVCMEQIETVVTISGAGLSPLAVETATGQAGLAIPTVTLRQVQDPSGAPVDGPARVIPDDGEPPRVRWTSSTSMEITVAPDLALVPGVYEVTVENRNGHSADLELAIAAVPRPTLTEVAPDLLCVDGAGRSITLRGAGFLDADGALPTVTVGDVDVPVEALADCVELAGPTPARSCATATLTVPTASLAAGTYPVVLVNPAPADCHSTEPVALTIVPPPQLATVEPDLLCVAEGARALTLTGSGFLVVDGAAPTVVLSDGTTELTVPVDAATGCQEVTGTSLAAQSCTSLQVTVDAATPTGAYQVTVVNPLPADCASAEAVTVAVVPPPTVTTTEGVRCDAAADWSVTLQGAGFIVLGGATYPTVTVGAVEATVTAAEGCTAIAGTLLDAASCTRLTAVVPGAALAEGTYPVTVENPPPAGCGSAGTVTVTLLTSALPVLLAVTPFKLCVDGGTFAVTADPAGGAFAAGAQIAVRLAGTADPFVPVTTTWIDGHHLDGTFAAGELAAGRYDVGVANAVGCDPAPLPGALDVVNAPFVFFVDPPSIYDAMDMVVTVHASGLSGSITSVTATAGDGTVVPLEIYDASDPSRVQVSLPAGLLGPGDYDLTVVDEVCAGTLPDGLHVTGTVTVWVEGIELPFGYRGEDTPVTIRSLAAPPAGMVPFAATPRAYLSPTSGGGVARELRSVLFYDPARLTGVVPAGLGSPAADVVYDLVVINPDGAVGVRYAAFTVHENLLPIISELTPGTASGQDDQHVTIRGSSFAPDAAVSASCRWLEVIVDPFSGAITVVEHTGSLAANAGAGDPAPWVDASRLETIWDFTTAGIGEGAVCVVRVTNVSDGTYAEYSALMVTPASSNPNAFVPSQDLGVGRRAAAAAALRLNRLDRFVFAIGGDNGCVVPCSDGSTLAEHASVEAVRVDPYGEMETWTPQRNALPAGRSFATAAGIGRYVYLPGGRVGGAPTASLLRAYLLQPDEAPDIHDLELALAQTGGLAAGTWTYRVAAVLDASDPDNPLGETLASEPLVLRVPDTSGIGKVVHITLHWTAVPNAATYRVYRTPVVGGIAGQEVLLAETIDASLSFTDDGTFTVDPARAPLPLGSLGTWHEVHAPGSPTVPVALAAAREGAAVVAVEDPNDDTRTYLYIAGGRDGGALTSIERLTVTTDPVTQHQTVTGFATLAAALPDGRWQIGALAVDHDLAPVVPASAAWIYVLPGAGALGLDVSRVTAFQVDTADGAGADDGSLGPAVEVDSPVSGGGYGYVARNGFLYLLGGGGSPSPDGRSAALCTTGTGTCNGGAPEPPDLVNWNAGITMTVERYLHATAEESGFVFLIGGATFSEPATTSTENSNI